MLIQEIILKNGKKVEVYHDEGAMNPIHDFDMATGFYFFHKRYDVGHKHEIDTDLYDSYADLANGEFGEKDLVLPVFCYSKRVFELSLTPFSCPWDSGQLGFAVVHDHIIQDEFDGDRIKALNCLKAELELYNHYLNGRTYGYISYDAEGNDINRQLSINGIISHIHIVLTQ
jgi:hypothetical protein